MKILVTDDIETQRDTLRKMLESLGHKVKTANSGEECLIELNMDKYDMLFLDIHMPKMDGYEVLKRKVCDTVTIVVTADRLDAGSIVEAIHSGASFYVQKPVRLDKLKEALKVA